MKKKYNAFAEHYLVPAVLFLLNICLVHLIHAFTFGSMYSLASKMALTVALVLMIASLFAKKQILLGGSLLFYVLVAFWVL